MHNEPFSKWLDVGSSMPIRRADGMNFSQETIQERASTGFQICQKISLCVQLVHHCHLDEEWFSYGPQTLDGWWNHICTWTSISFTCSLALYWWTRCSADVVLFCQSRQRFVWALAMPTLWVKHGVFSRCTWTVETRCVQLHLLSRTIFSVGQNQRQEDEQKSLSKNSVQIHLQINDVYIFPQRKQS